MRGRVGHRIVETPVLSSWNAGGASRPRQGYDRVQPNSAAACQCCRPIGTARGHHARTYRCAVDGYSYESAEPLTCGEACERALRAELEQITNVLSFGGQVVRSPIDL